MFELRRQSITGVTAEELIAAVTGEDHGDIAARQLRDEVRRDLRRIGERLIVKRRQAWNDLEGIMPRLLASNAFLDSTAAEEAGVELLVQGRSMR